MGACFDYGETIPTVRIRRGATIREVFHELWHVETYRRLLKLSSGDHAEARRKYEELGRPRREVEVYESWMRRPNLWNRLSDEEKRVETDNYESYHNELRP